MSKLKTLADYKSSIIKRKGYVLEQVKNIELVT